MIRSYLDLAAEGVRRDPARVGLTAASVALAVAVALPAASLVRLERWMPPGLGLVLRPEGPDLLDTGIGWSASVLSPEGLQGESLEGLVALLVTLSALVILVTAVNLAALLADHLTARRRELALCRALGASRSQIRIQLAVEAFVPLSAGAVIGLAVGVGALEALRAGIPPSLSAPGGISPDPETTLLLLALPTAAVVAVYVWTGAGRSGWPLNRRGRGNLPLSHLAGAPISTGAVRALAVLQVAGLTVLGVAGGLLLRGPGSPDTGTGAAPDAVDTLAVEVALEPSLRSAPPSQRVAAYRALSDGLAASFDATRVTTASRGAVLGLGPEDRILCRGCSLGAMTAPVVRVRARLHAVGPGFFDTLQIGLVSGTALPADGETERSRAAVVNRAFAARYGTRPGRVRLQLPGRKFHEGWYEVVGVVENLQAPGLGVSGERVPAVYLSALRHPPANATLFVAGGARAADAPGRASRVASAVPGFSVGSVGPLALRLEGHLEPLREGGRAAAVLAAFALAAAVFGLGAFTLLTLRRRWREVGIRRAAGARRRDIYRMLLGDAGRMLRTGVSVGLVLAWGIGRGLAHWFPEVRPADPLLYLCLASLLAGVVVLATWIPARRALRLPPTELLRSR